MLELMGGTLLVLGGGLMSASSIAIARPPRAAASLQPIGEVLAAAFSPPTDTPADLDTLIGRLAAID